MENERIKKAKEDFKMAQQAYHDYMESMGCGSDEDNKVSNNLSSPLGPVMERSINVAFTMEDLQESDRLLRFIKEKQNKLNTILREENKLSK